MGNNWKKYKLGDICEIQNGYAFSSKDFSGVGVPIIKIKNVVPPYILLDDAQCFNREINSALEKYLISFDDILISMTGSTVNQMSSAVGKIGRYKHPFPALLNQRVGKLYFTAEEKADYNYLYYYVSRFEIQYQLALNATGSANQANISPNQIKDLEILLPPLPEQRAIAEILSALDDKIELNLQMNKTLEDMANALYKHWFVDFGPFLPKGRSLNDGKGPMPGFVESELGLIPEGWEVSYLKHLISDLNNKRAPISSMEREKITGQYPYYGATGILDYVNKFAFDGRYILVAEDGTVKNAANNPFTQFVEGKFWVSNHAHIIVGNKSHPSAFVYFTLKNVNVLPYITGAVQPKLSKGNLESIVVLKPASEIAIKYAKIVDDYIDLIFQKKAEIENLKNTRDYLLPKLISGEIRVKEAEQKIKHMV